MGGRDLQGKRRGDRAPCFTSLGFRGRGKNQGRRTHVKGENTRVYGRDEVQAAERRAWARDEGRKHYYDGIHFWISEEGSRQATKHEVAPEWGWQHRAGCTCPLCRGREPTRRDDLESKR